MLNSISISGRLTRDPAIHTITSNRTGKPVQFADFTLACDRNYPDKNGDYQPDFFRVSTTRSVNYIKTFHQGDSLIVNGSIHNNTYTDKQGNTHYGTEIRAFQVSSGGRSRKNREQMNSQSGSNGAFSAPKNRTTYPGAGKQIAKQKQGQTSYHKNSTAKKQGSKIDPFAKSGSKKLNINDNDLPF